MIFPKPDRQRRILWVGMVLAGMVLVGMVLIGGDSSGYFHRPVTAPKQIFYPVSRSIPVFHADTDPHENLSIQTAPISSALVLPSAPSDFYGSILVPEDTTIYRMITIVYGTFSPELFDQVMACNSTIPAPDKLVPGVPFHFPAPKQEKAYPDHTIFLVIYQTREFNPAFTRAASVVYRDLDVRILAFHCQDTGYLFNVIIDRPFENKQQASAFLRKISPGITAVSLNAASLKSCRLIHTEE